MKSFGGVHCSNIGLCFATTSSGPLASRVVPGSSAWMCGEILPGDRIISIGGSSARLLSEEQLLAAANGPPDTIVHLVVDKRAKPDRPGGHAAMDLRRFDVGGIGIRFEKRRGRFVVTWMERSGAADRSQALGVGDEILTVDGEVTEKMSSSEVIGAICGEDGTTVTLGVVSAERGQEARLKVRRVTLWRESRRRERSRSISPLSAPHSREPRDRRSNSYEERPNDIARRAPNATASPRSPSRSRLGVSQTGSQRSGVSQSGSLRSSSPSRSRTGPPEQLRTGFSQSAGAPPPAREVQLGQAFYKGYSQTPGPPAAAREVQLGQAFGKSYSQTAGPPPNAREVQLGEAFGKSYSQTAGPPPAVREVQLGQVFSKSYSQTAGGGSPRHAACASVLLLRMLSRLALNRTCDVRCCVV